MLRKGIISSTEDTMNPVQKLGYSLVNSTIATVIGVVVVVVFGLWPEPRDFHFLEYLGVGMFALFTAGFYWNLDRMGER
jgi:hypothetical protein